MQHTSAENFALKLLQTPLDTMSSSSSDTDSDSDSDTNVSSQLREDVIRQKLLASFYGTTTPVPSTNSNSNSNSNSSSSSSSNSNLPPPPPTTTTTTNTTNSSSNKPNSKSDSRSLDSSSFDSLAYSRNLLAKSSISTLLTTDTSLVTSVKRLDSTMQTLVYENYSKFISATDAIRSIGQSVDSAESAMNKLQSTIDAVSNGATQLDDSLKHSRNDVKEKIRVKRHLQKLDSLLNLPTTLKILIQDKQYLKAATAYDLSKPVLEKHSPSFLTLDKIKQEVNTIIQNLSLNLTHELETSAPKSTKATFTIAAALKTINDGVSLHKKEATEFATSLLTSKMNFDDEYSFLIRIHRAATQFSGAFPTPPRDHDASLADFVTLHFESYLGTTVKNSLSELCSNFSPSASHTIKSSLLNFIAATKKFAQVLNEDPIGLPTTLTSKYLDSAYALATAIVGERVENIYGELRNDCVANLCDFLGGFEKPATGEVVIVMLNSLVNMHKQILTAHVTPLVGIPVSSLTISQSIQSHSANFLIWLGAAFEMSSNCYTPSSLTVSSSPPTENHDHDHDHDYSANNNNDDDKAERSRRQLAIATADDSFDTDVSALGVAAKKATIPTNSKCTTVQLIFAEAGRISNEALIGRVSDHVEDALAEFPNASMQPDEEMNAVVRLRFSITTQNCLHAYIFDVGHAASTALCVGVNSSNNATGWTCSEKEVRSPRECLRLMLSIVRLASLDVAEMRGGEGFAVPAKDIVGVEGVGGGGGGNIGIGGRRSTLGGGGLLDKLFSEKICVFGENEFTRESVVVGILKIALRTLLLRARSVIFSKFGARQLNVDVQLLSIVLKHYVEESSVVETLIGDLKTVASERCCAPVEEGDGPPPSYVESAVMGVIINRWMEAHRNDEVIFIIMDDE